MLALFITLGTLGSSPRTGVPAERCRRVPFGNLKCGDSAHRTASCSCTSEVSQCERDPANGSTARFGDSHVMGDTRVTRAYGYLLSQ